MTERSDAGGRGVPPGETRPGFAELLSTRGFGLVFVGLILSYGLAAGFSGRPLTSLVLVVQIATVFVALRAAEAGRVFRRITLAAMVLAVVAGGANLVGSGSGPLAVVFIAGGLLYLVTPAAVLRWIIGTGRVDRQIVLGAIDAYIMIGMFFAFAYRAVGIVMSGPFFGAGGDGTTPQALFFSFTTLTTTGYGNLVPANTLGQSMAVMEMLAGQLFLVTAIAKIIGAWRPQRWGAGAGGGPAAPPGA